MDGMREKIGILNSLTLCGANHMARWSLAIADLFESEKIELFPQLSAGYNQSGLVSFNILLRNPELLDEMVEVSLGFVVNTSSVRVDATVNLTFGEILSDLINEDIAFTSVQKLIFDLDKLLSSQDDNVIKATSTNYCRRRNKRAEQSLGMK